MEHAHVRRLPKRQAGGPRARRLRPTAPPPPAASRRRATCGRMLASNSDQNPRDWHLIIHNHVSEASQVTLRRPNKNHTPPYAGARQSIHVFWLRRPPGAPPRQPPRPVSDHLPRPARS